MYLHFVAAVCALFVLGACSDVVIGSSRLPLALQPQHYKLKIRTYLPHNFTVIGKVWMQVNCLASTDNITLHVHDLDLNRPGITVMDITNSDSPKMLEISGFDEKNEHDLFTVRMSQPLVVGRAYGVYIPWRSEIKDALDGFYRSSYDDKKSGKKKWIGVTHFEPDGARKTFPCFDEPAMKATYDIIIGRSGEFSAVSNMPISKTEPIKEEQGWFWDKFQRSVPMSTYLVAWMVSDFGYLTSAPSKQNNVTFRTWARHSALDQAEFAREIGPMVLDFFERYFEVPYPLPKQDLVALPDFNAGAMENWGLITFRETTLLYDPVVSSFLNMKSVAGVVAHELAHQWFGNLVTMEWWNDLWLNEGFATYMASLALDKLFPDWHTLNNEVYSNMQNVFSTDVLQSSHPISAAVEHARDIHERFDQITYQKGSLLIRMLSYILGDEGLRQSIVSYLKKHAYKNARQEDFFDALSTTAHRLNRIPRKLSIKMIMDSWTLQTGFPYITVIRDYTANSALVSQARYNPEGKSGNECWYVPMSYGTGRNQISSQLRGWLECPKKAVMITDLATPNDWVLFNVKSGGIYRVNYDERNWMLLSAMLRTSQQENVPVLNKAALIEDSFDFAWYGYLNYSVPFNLIRYLPMETEYLPWTAALSKLSTIDSELRKVSFYGDFREYFKTLLGPAYANVGGFAKARTQRYDAESYQNRIVGLACKVGVEACLEDAKKLYQRWREDPKSNPLPPSLRGIIFSQAIKYGGEADWNFLWKEYAKSNVNAEKYSILMSLGASTEYWLLRRYLDWSLESSSGIRRQDAANVFQFVANSQLGYFAAKSFLLTNVKKISDYINSNRIGVYIRAILGGVTTEEEYEEMVRFINNNQQLLAKGKVVVAQSLEKAKSRIRWHKEHLMDIKNTLKHLSNEQN